MFSNFLVGAFTMLGTILGLGLIGVTITLLIKDGISVAGIVNTALIVTLAGMGVIAIVSAARNHYRK